MSALPLPAAPASSPVPPLALPGGLSLPVGRTAIMGILNVTPDSFSDGGEHDSLASALESAAQMVEEGADIIDVGGESTRPGAPRVEADTELARVLPVVAALAAAGVTVAPFVVPSP